MNRRQILETGLIGGAAVLAGCGKPAETNTNNTGKTTAISPYTDKLGVQLYTLRTLFETDFRTTLKALADIGYKDIEFAGYFDHTPREIKSLMDDLGLESHSTHVQLADMHDNFDAAVETAQEMGQTNLIIPWLHPDERTIDSYKAIADLLNRRGEAVRDADMRVAYHNHEFEFEIIDDQVPYNILLDETDSKFVSMEIDFFWARKANIDPVALFNRAPGRFIACHIKDMSSTGDMVDVGDGEIDFGEIFKHAETAGLQRFYVEHDQPADPITSVTRSFQHLAV